MMKLALIASAAIASAQAGILAAPGYAAPLPAATYAAGYALPAATYATGYAPAALPAATYAAGYALPAATYATGYALPAATYAAGYAPAALPIAPKAYAAAPLPAPAAIPIAKKAYAVPAPRTIETPAKVATITTPVEQHGYKIRY